MTTDSEEVFDDYEELLVAEYEEIFNDDFNTLSFSFSRTIDDYYCYYIHFENDYFKAKMVVSYYLLELKRFIEKANSYNLKINDTVDLFEADSDGYLSFRKTDDLGHFELDGMIGDTHCPYSLKFKIDVDQTVLKFLAGYFQKYL